MTKPPLASLPLFGYDAILADPPWSYEMYSEKGYEKSPEAHYATMSDEDVLNLPVGDLASAQCLLVLWCVWPKLPLAIACVKRWGFKYVTGGSWVKMTKDGSGLRIGTGYTMRSACEPFLIGRTGRPQARVTNIANAILAAPREHSRKPDEMRVIVERMTPKAKRIELFAREPWPGNHVWGNETEKF
jgi:N6-adenosine-specific RNA methylase IME4